MAIEPKYERIASAERIKLGVTQAVIECKLPASEETEIAKILCANAKSFIVEANANEKEINFLGNVNFQIIYEDSNEIANGIDYTADFKDKFASDEIKANYNPIVSSSVVDVNTSTIGSDVKVVAIVEIEVSAIRTNEIDALVNVNNENVFINKELTTISTFSGILNNKFDVQHDIEIKDNVAKVLEVSCCPFVENVEAFDGYAKVSGGTNIDICYVTSDEDNLLRTYQTKVKFNEEVQLDKLTSLSCVQSSLNINNSKIKITTNIDADNAIVNLELPYEFLGYVFNKQEIEIVDDIFSTDTYLNVTTESFNSLVCGGKLNLENKVMGSVECENEVVDEILGTCCNTVTLASCFLEEDKMVLEGVATTTVLYLNKETMQTHSMVVDMPFSLNETVKDVTDKFYPSASVSLGEVSAKAKRGKEIEVSATLFVYADFYSKNCEACIKDVKETDEKMENMCELSIYIVKENETVWEIAKALNISPDSLLEQNPQVSLPLCGGEKLVLYRQKEILF